MAFLNEENKTRTLEGNEVRTITGSQSLKVQFTGPGAETLIDQGPPAGHSWKIKTVVSITEYDV